MSKEPWVVPAQARSARAGQAPRLIPLADAPTPARQARVHSTKPHSSRMSARRGKRCGIGCVRQARRSRQSSGRPTPAEAPTVIGLCLCGYPRPTWAIWRTWRLTRWGAVRGWGPGYSSRPWPKMERMAMAAHGTPPRLAFWEVRPPEEAEDDADGFAGCGASASTSGWAARFCPSPTSAHPWPRASRPCVHRHGASMAARRRD